MTKPLNTNRVMVLFRCLSLLAALLFFMTASPALAQDSTGEAETTAEADTAQLHRLVVFYGRPWKQQELYIGYIVEETALKLRFRPVGQGVLNFSMDEVLDLTPLDESQYPDGTFYILSTNYTTGANAMPLQRRNGYFVTWLGLENRFRTGISPHFTVHGGINLQSWATGGLPQADVALHYNHSFGKRLHVGIGPLVDMDPVLGEVNVPNHFNTGAGAEALVTVGQGRNHMSLGAGAAYYLRYANTRRWVSSGLLFKVARSLSLAHYTRVMSPRYNAVDTELWAWESSTAVKYFRNRYTWDVGLRVWNDHLAEDVNQRFLPYLGVTYSY